MATLSARVFANCSHTPAPHALTPLTYPQDVGCSKTPQS